MTQLARGEVYQESQVETGRSSTDQAVRLVDFLLLLDFVRAIFTPYFIWQGYLPSSFKFGHLALSAAGVMTVVRMLNLGRIPGAVLVIVGVSAITVTVALFRGQGFLVTSWGWWLFFQYPLLALYAYLHPRWPSRFPRLLLNACVAIVVFQTIFQVGQYLTGERIGDRLAGTLSSGGAVGRLQFVILFTICMALGELVAWNRWKPLLLVGSFAIPSNVLAWNKFFPVAAALPLSLASMLLIGRGRQVGRAVVLISVLALGVGAFIVVNNELLAGQARRPWQDLVLDEEFRDDYLDKSSFATSDYQTYGLGRTGAVKYALESISTDPVTFISGFGIGSRIDSESLGIAGLRLRQSYVVKTGGLGGLIIQQWGVFGLLLLGGFMVGAIWALARDISRWPDSPALGLRYALILFTAFWPVWLWYKPVLGFRAAMLLYWVSLGYVFNEAAANRQEPNPWD